MKVLVAAPHPDDDLIGCGGTMIRHRQAGSSVTVVYMTSGDAGNLKMGKAELAEVREAETRDAMSRLGINDLIFVRNEDGYLRYDKSNLIRLTKLIREKQPDIIYLPHRHEAHPDHRETFNIFTEAARRAGGPWFQECGAEPWTVKNILCYEVWTPIREVAHVEDITDFMEAKIEALRRHSSQTGEIPYDEAARALNRFRGITTGRGRYCECYEVLSMRGLKYV